MESFTRGPNRLTYDVTGDGPPLALIHGLAGSRLWWRRNVRALEREYRVFTVDLVGFGHARRQRPLPIRAGADLILAWLDALKLERPRIIGHSMGGHIALHVAAARPDGVSALVLAAPSALVTGRLRHLAMRLPLASLAGAPDFLPTLAFDAARAGPLTLIRAAREIVRDDVSDAIARVRAPVLLVWGARDVLVPPELGVRLAAKLPGARLVVIPGAGHNVMWDRPDAFNRVTLEFLRAHEAR